MSRFSADMGGRKPSRPARDCALSILERADRTEQEMRSKLSRRGYGQEDIDEAISFLSSYRYIDDGAYVCRYIRSHSGRKSRRQLKAELEQKGVARELIESGLQEESVDEERQIRQFLQKKGIPWGEKMEPEAYRKMTAALGRRGYSYETIRQVVEQMVSGEF